MKTFDIVVLNETHFNERVKCPDGFIFEGRSTKVDSKVPRGGTAIYKNKQSPLCIEIVCNTLRDCVIAEVKNSGIVIVAQYIPPSNSVYYDDIYFENMDLIYKKFSRKRLLVLGDLNARIGDVTYIDQLIKHTKNPDSIINSNGRNLMKWMNQRQDMI